MAHQHDSHDAHDLHGASRRSLIIVLLLTVAYIMVEIVAFFESNSLAILAHATHMLRDLAVIVMSLFAMWLSRRGSSSAYTYGHRRVDVLAATINALSLWLIAGLIFYNAFGRIGAIGEPHEHEEVEGVLVLIVGAIGLAVNIISAWVLHRSSQHSLNIQGVFQHLIADVLTSVGVIISGILVITLDWDAADHYISVIIGIVILVSSWRLVTGVFRVLMESTPAHIDVYKLCGDIEDIEGVTLVHDIHVWTIASGYEAFTAHVLIDPDIDEAEMWRMRDRIHDIVRDDFDIEHITIQMDKPPLRCAEEDHLDHLHRRSMEEAQGAV